MNPLGGDGSGDGDIERRGIGRGRGRGPWTSSSQEIPILRRPHHATSGMQTGSMESKNVEQNKLDKSFDDIIQNSTLSVHAAEFIPKSYPIKQLHHQQQPSTRYLQKHSVQDRLQIAREIPLQVQMMQQNFACNYGTSQHYQQTEQVQQFDNLSHQQEQSSNIHDFGHFDGGSGDYRNKHQDSNIEDDNYLIEFANITQNLMSVIHALILNPGHFTSIVPPLINNLRPYLGFPSQFKEIMKIIIQQSINEGNFRYSGARLCAFLDNSLTSIEQTSFRWTLCTLCKNETDSQASNWQQKEDHSEEEQKRCNGLILLLAELVTQMDDTSAFTLGDLLIQFIIIILKKPAPNSVKNICQALKLAGQTLEKNKNENRRKEMENMMRALTELVTEGRVDSHVGHMVHSVHELRNGNWGQNSLNSSTVESIEPLDPNQAIDEPVLYGPDGKVLTPEENKFLEEVPDSTTNIEDHIISEHGYEGDETWMSEDDDIDAAYEEFLKHIPKQIKNQSQK
ncbi:polyadenylate-binding protein-interacting protein 1-like isoform X1 [Apis dorsata]|uniref:polyadenylate-binding protein-interacting protein 1-like isoform X1 n=1 Tax=Apis dorsata TaxID=7462 RepID=UPI0003DF5F04|nr:polyadenylate-binding protein-interacting protein 1-like isoform X1 [Apis dorsata]